MIEQLEERLNIPSAVEELQSHSVQLEAIDLSTFVMVIIAE